MMKTVALALLGPPPRPSRRRLSPRAPGASPLSGKRRGTHRRPGGRARRATPSAPEFAFVRSRALRSRRFSPIRASGARRPPCFRPRNPRQRADVGGGGPPCGAPDHRLGRRAQRARARRVRGRRRLGRDGRACARHLRRAHHRAQGQSSRPPSEAADEDRPGAARSSAFAPLTRASLGVRAGCATKGDLGALRPSAAFSTFSRLRATPVVHRGEEGGQGGRGLHLRGGQGRRQGRAQDVVRRVHEDVRARRHQLKFGAHGGSPRAALVPPRARANGPRVTASASLSPRAARALAALQRARRHEGPGLLERLRLEGAHLQGRHLPALKRPAPKSARGARGGCRRARSRCGERGASDCFERFGTRGGHAGAAFRARVLARGACGAVFVL